MSLQGQITTLVQAIGGDVRTLTAAQGNLSALTTTQKTSLVGAINELQGLVGGLTGAPSVINDAAAAGVTDRTYSADKIIALLASLRGDILGGASAAYDTLLELQTGLQNEQTATNNILTALGNRVRFDAAQTLTSAQQAQALANIGAASAASIGNTERDFVADYVAAKV